MGQTHSSNSEDKSDKKDISTGKKVDYYDLLGVERRASGEEIKKAYRKKALELHPDRNFHNVESATKLFAEIQSAYEVLSDPQERSWYDSHREAFLGSDFNAEETNYSYDTRMTTADDVLKLFSRFSPRMDFSDSPGGFYGGLHETFSRLALEEKIACRWESMEYSDYPDFGFSDDSFVDVVRPFYAVWGGFSTKKSFAWKDMYRYSDAPDRRVRRLMEKENKRLRDESIREFNEAVRSLVAFVKKRDPRYSANAQTEIERQELLRRTAAAQAARSRAVNRAKLRDHIVQDWAKSEYTEEELTDDSEEEMEQFECVACHKNFKSLNQFEAHERSKKHIKAVKQLRWEMKMESRQLGLDTDAPGPAGNLLETPSMLQSESRTTSPLRCGQSDEILRSLQRGNEPGPKEKSLPENLIQDDDGDKYLAEQGSSADVSCSENIKTAEGADYVSRETIEDRLSSLTFSTPGKSGKAEATLASPPAASDSGEPTPSFPRRAGKAKQKRVKKAQRAAAQSPGMSCTACNLSFPSRNQLFLHIRNDHGHAEPSPKKSNLKNTMI